MQETQEMWFDPWVGKIPLEESMATHSSILAWRIPWTEESGRLHPWGHTESDITEVTHSLKCQIMLNVMKNGHACHLPNTILQYFGNYFWYLSPCVCISHSVVSNSLAHQASLFMEFSRQERILEWVAIPFLSVSSWPRDPTWVSWIASRFFTAWATREMHLPPYI